MSRFTLYQFVSLLILIASLIIVHLNFTVHPILTDYHSVYLMLIFHFWICSFIYLLFLLEAKKDKTFFSCPIWSKMPIIMIVIGTISLALFLYFAMDGTMMNFIAQSAWIVYPMFIFFYFFVFTFIFSLKYRRKETKQNIVKTVHLTFLWTTLLLVGVFIFF